jgi:hypothetical protein
MVPASTTGRCLCDGARRSSAEEWRGAGPRAAPCSEDSTIVTRPVLSVLPFLFVLSVEAVLIMCLRTND